jgi:non-ribosomal peptide synthetase component F
MLRHAAVKLFAYENTRRSTMRQDVGETREVSRLELLRRASRQGDLEAWAAFQQGLEETVLSWFYTHPGSEAASRVHSDRYFVAQALEQLWHLGVQGQVACETLSEVLVCLRVSLNGAILETLRVSRRPGAVLSHGPDEEECVESSVIWGRLQAELSNQRERRLAYLLFHCGLSPREIVRCCPQDFDDIHEVYGLRRTIMERLLCHADQLGLATLTYE